MRQTRLPWGSVCCLDLFLSLPRWALQPSRFQPSTQGPLHPAMASSVLGGQLREVLGLTDPASQGLIWVGQVHVGGRRVGRGGDRGLGLQGGLRGAWADTEAAQPFSLRLSPTARPRPSPALHSRGGALEQPLWLQTQVSPRPQLQVPGPPLPVPDASQGPVPRASTVTLDNEHKAGGSGGRGAKSPCTHVGDPAAAPDFRWAQPRQWGPHGESTS